MQASSNEPALVVRELSKTYFLNHHGTEYGLAPKSKRKQVQALAPLSFTVYPGESIGILGKNGSGKSTLLSLIAGHIAPTSGEVLVRSTPALLSVNAAFQPHQTGASNIRLGLLAKGLTPGEVSQLEKSVADWTELGEALERPLNTYSSGQRARLQFAIATSVKPDILLIDEALATGDSSFTQKASARMKEFLNTAGVIFLVSHSPGTIRRHCRRAIWLHEGVVVSAGSAKRVSERYNRWTKLKSLSDQSIASRYVSNLSKSYTNPNVILSSEIDDHTWRNAL